MCNKEYGLSGVFDVGIVIKLQLHHFITVILYCILQS